LKSAAGINSFRYPKSTDCNALYALYGVNDLSAAASAKDQFLKYAKIDKPYAAKMTASGDYQCYCEKFKSIRNILKNGDKDICSMHFWDGIKALGLTNSVTVLVLVINIIIKYLVQYLIDRVGYDTESRRNQAVQIVTFVSAFLNTAIIPLFTNADLEFTGILSWIPIRMNFSDLDEGWYIQLGPQIVKTVFILAFMPYASMVISIGMRVPKQWLDSGFPCCKPKRVLNEAQI
jgi:hypothetical protein